MPLDQGYLGIFKEMYYLLLIYFEIFVSIQYSVNNKITKIFQKGKKKLLVNEKKNMVSDVFLKKLIFNIF